MGDDPKIVCRTSGLAEGDGGGDDCDDPDGKQDGDDDDDEDGDGWEEQVVAVVSTVENGEDRVEVELDGGRGDRLDFVFAADSGREVWWHASVGDVCMEQCTMHARQLYLVFPCTFSGLLEGGKRLRKGLEAVNEKGFGFKAGPLAWSRQSRPLTARRATHRPVAEQDGTTKA
ncbi:hypothetical protein FS842_009905 [Serendipita sp. 407]|nr:hypothetical protein FS842_009905 [Serendipita sp. 407]